MTSVVLGTRGSELALTQARMVREALLQAHEGVTCETRVIKTIGDTRQDLKLSQFSSEQIVDKGIFTKDLEVALAAGEIDVAVHSLKDVPTALDPGFALSAVLPRADTRDVLLTKEPCGGVAELRREARLATSSVRRRAQLQWRRPDLRVEEIRGNVPTRLRKLSEDENLNGILLALAGLQRLGYVEEGADRFDWKGSTLWVTPLGPPGFLPACGQGAIALETRSSDAGAQALVAAVNDAPTLARVTVERMILDRLQAGCHTPVGVDTQLEKGGPMSIHLRVFDEADLSRPPLEARVSGPTGDPAGLVDQLMHSLQ